MKLTVVVPVLGQHELATRAILNLLENMSLASTDIVVVDNGGDYSFPLPSPKVSVFRPGSNLGVYPVFKYAFDSCQGDVLAFFHSDLIVAEPGYDSRLLTVFNLNDKMGLIGFVGSNEIDRNGGRGGGTTSNFQGNAYFNSDNDNPMEWRGSPAHHHGMTNAGLTPAAVVDGCAMVIRRAAWDMIGYREDFPPHHFYDRLISTQMLELGWKVAVLGIACDHISGQTVSKESRYGDMAKEWCDKHGIAQLSADEPWDQVIYKAAERQWLKEYRDEKHMVPTRV